jgi:excisionase family DNA binding protein
MEAQAKNSNPIEKLLYKPKTIAAMTDMSLSQVYKLMADGTLKSRKCGRSIRVPAAALRDFVEGLGAN